VSQWQYNVDPRYDGTFPNQLVHSFADVDYYYQLKFQGGGWCTSTNAGIVEEPNDWSSTVPVYQYGIETADSFTFTYNDTAFKYQNGPYAPCSESWTSNAYVLKSRTLSCPKGTSISYQSDPPVGPTCEVPASTPNVFKQVGPCCNRGTGPGGGRTTKGDPIDVSNGNVYQSVVDYEGAGANALRFARSYNSLPDPILKDNPWMGFQFGSQIMGRGWTASYFQYLTPISVSDSTGTHSSVYVFRPEGRVLVFSLYDGVYSPDADVPDSLIQTPSGWAYQTADDTIETYNSDGQLLSITPRGQAPITINYARAGGPPSSVADAFGHMLQFTYVAASSNAQQLQSITDPSGASIQYAYDSSGHLVSVTHQDGTVTGYSYGNFGLTSITDESSVPYETWTYSDYSGLVSGTQLAGGVGAYSVRYATSGPGGSVSVADPLGTVRTYPQQLIWGS